MNIYRVISALLSYPEADMLAALPEIRTVVQTLDAPVDLPEVLAPLLDYLSAHDLITLQENYVATFDRNPSQALHLFEHIHGESRDRGQAMVDLLQEYQRRGFEPDSNEIPDYLPLFLEFLSCIPAEEAEPMLGEAIHVIAAIGARLRDVQSPYANALLVLTAYTEVEPRQQSMPPVRDMDEVMEKFGPGADGTEPLLRPGKDEQVVRFYPKSAANFESTQRGSAS
ncbi:nitrate reductase molybdenum cofactor assembly chaperone [Undibacterium squillarum]|uniref:nitrate reductase molybdenum cofactor assembly chaperone n=1 Tax=Undibacterium squillarum TaxID=1131567 RepID=UPI0035B41C5C